MHPDPFETERAERDPGVHPELGSSGPSRPGSDELSLADPPGGGKVEKGEALHLCQPTHEGLGKGPGGSARRDQKGRRNPYHRFHDGPREPYLRSSRRTCHEGGREEVPDLIYSCEKKELNLRKGFILLDDPFISMIGSDFTQGEVPPHPYPPPPRGEGWVGEDHSCSFLCTIKV